MSEGNRGDPDERNRAQAALDARVSRIESVLVAFAAGLGMVSLVLGELLPYLTFTVGGARPGEMTPSLASYGFRAVAFRNDDGAVDTVAVSTGIAFLGLLAVVIAALAALVVIARRAGGSTSTRWMGIVATLLVVGVLGMWLTAALGVGSDDFALHQGPFWLTTGAVIFALLVGSPAARAWWVRPTSG